MALVKPAAAPCPHQVVASVGDEWQCCTCWVLFADRHEVTDAAFDTHVVTALAVIA